MAAALGLIEVEGVAGLILAADAACKAAQVELMGWESIGGYTTLFLRGSVSDVAVALKSGEQAAREVVGKVVAASLNQPDPACGRYVSFPRQPDAPVRPGALGLVETRGYGAHVSTNDHMVKTAAVEVVNVLTVHNRVVCSLVQGEVGAVREAIAAGRQRLVGYAHLLGTALIAQPRPEVLQVFAVRRGGGSGV
jgi:microcompartment protein CcmL/EutN